MIKSLLAALALMLFISPAWAHTCPALMDEIDQALEDDAVVDQLEDGQLVQVRKLRQQGEEFHAQGEHDKSEKTLNEAIETLDI